MIHSFLKPGTSASITQILGRDIYLNQTSRQFKSIIYEEEESDNTVFFLELGLYLDEKADTSMSEVRNKLATLGCIDGATFESILPFYDYLTRDPPVVETNKVHGCEYCIFCRERFLDAGAKIPEARAPPDQRYLQPMQFMAS